MINSITERLARMTQSDSHSIQLSGKQKISTRSFLKVAVLGTAILAGNVSAGTHHNSTELVDLMSDKNVTILSEQVKKMTLDFQKNNLIDERSRISFFDNNRDQIVSLDRNLGKDTKSNSYQKKIQEQVDNPSPNAIVDIEVTKEKVLKRLYCNVAVPKQVVKGRGIEFTVEEQTNNTNDKNGVLRMITDHEIGHCVNGILMVQDGVIKKESSVLLKESFGDVFSVLREQQVYQNNNKKAIQDGSMSPVSNLVKELIRSRFDDALVEPEHETGLAVYHALKLILENPDKLNEASASQIAVTTQHIINQMTPQIIKQGLFQENLSTYHEVDRTLNEDEMIYHAEVLYHLQTQSNLEGIKYEVTSLEKDIQLNHQLNNNIQNKLNKLNNILSIKINSDFSENIDKNKNENEIKNSELSSFRP